MKNKELYELVTVIGRLNNFENLDLGWKFAEMNMQIEEKIEKIDFLKKSFKYNDEENELVQKIQKLEGKKAMSTSNMELYKKLDEELEALLESEKDLLDSMKNKREKVAEIDELSVDEGEESGFKLVPIKLSQVKKEEKLIKALSTSDKKWLLKVCK